MMMIRFSACIACLVLCAGCGEDGSMTPTSMASTAAAGTPAADPMATSPSPSTMPMTSPSPATSPTPSTSPSPATSPSSAPGSAPPSAPATLYSMRDIGAYTSPGATAIDDHDNVVVAQMSGNGSFFYQNASGSVVQLQAVNVGTDTVIANGINDKGQISGWSGEHAVIWLTSGGYSILGGDNPTHAEGINQSGVVVGDRFVGHADGSPTSWDPNGVQTDLSTEVGTAIAVNDQGLMVGDAASSGSYPSYGPQHAMVWQSATSADLGTLSGDQISSAQGVANSGDIVGISQGTQVHAVLWHAGAISDLGSLGASSPTASSAAGINDAGEIVGRSADRK